MWNIQLCFIEAKIRQSKKSFYVRAIFGVEVLPQAGFMTQRRPIINGEIMFITTNVRDRRKIFSHAPFAREAIEILYRVQSLHPFLLYGFVFMPDHCHLLLRIPQTGSVSTVLNRFKMGVSHALGMGPIWQPRYYMKIASNPSGALRYIHANPVQANITKKPEDYFWSSACGKWDVAELE